MPTDPKLVELEILKAIHRAKFQRWQKRRNYEWLLSYSIWGGLAGFIAVVAFGKDSSFTAPRPWALVTTLFFTVAVHAFHLYLMVENTLLDLSAQEDLEEMMKELSSYGRSEPQLNRETENSPHGGPSTSTRFDPPVIAWWRNRAIPFLRPRYGFLAQTVITILLCVVAGWAGMAPKQTPPAPTPVTPASVCEGCAQYFTPPSATVSPYPRPTVGQDNAPKKNAKSRKTIRHLP
jgi:hypothetical protein